MVLNFLVHYNNGSFKGVLPIKGVLYSITLIRGL
jgi:hypothetical protein